MKIIKSNFFYIIICLLGVMPIFAAPHPPSPGYKEADIAPPLPPGTPIDNGIILLFILALIYGLFILIRHHLKTKKLHSSM